MSRQNVTNTSTSPQRLAYALEEVAGATGLSVSFLRLEITRGKLRASRAGRRVLVTANELQKYLEPHPEF